MVKKHRFPTEFLNPLRLPPPKAADRSEGIILRVGEKFGFIKLGLLRWVGGVPRFLIRLKLLQVFF